MNAFFEGLHAEFYVPGTNICSWYFQRFEMNLYYMNNYLSVPHHLNPVTQEDEEGTFFNITLSIMPHIPFTLYFCYQLPGKADDLWTNHLKEFDGFKDFEYAFMQNLLGNILSFMDAYEISAKATAVEDYITVVKQFGRIIRRVLTFGSMLTEASPFGLYGPPIVGSSEIEFVENPILPVLFGRQQTQARYEEAKAFDDWRKEMHNTTIHVVRGATGFAEGFLDS